MDKRTLNRRREHSQEGHSLSEETTGNNVSKVNPITGTPRGLFSCTCGWQGWLDLK